MNTEDREVVSINEEDFPGVMMRIWGEMLEPVDYERRSLVLCELMLRFLVVAEREESWELAGDLAGFHLLPYVRHLNRIKTKLTISPLGTNLDRSISRGVIAGQMLFEMLRLVRHYPDSVKLGIVYDLVRAKVAKKGVAASTETLKNIWGKWGYRRISHLWAAQVVFSMLPPPSELHGEKLSRAKEIFPTGRKTLLTPRKEPIEFLANASEAFYVLANNEFMQTSYGKVSRRKSQRILGTCMHIATRWTPKLKIRIEPQDIEGFLLDFNDKERALIESYVNEDKQIRTLLSNRKPPRRRS